MLAAAFFTAMGDNGGGGAQEAEDWGCGGCGCGCCGDRGRGCGGRRHGGLGWLAWGVADGCIWLARSNWRRGRRPARRRKAQREEVRPVAVEASLAPEARPVAGGRLGTMRRIGGGGD
uniref:Uncharacterized protein n=1 Tax=Oryza rufipogon TaxID=4529 RepID=A0A0E0QNF3_ORYRU